MADKRILDKIKKCLALASSSNEHEAKAAMQRAQALMKKHGITSNQVDLADVKTQLCNAQSVDNPPQYYQYLLSLIGYAFGVHCVYRPRYYQYTAAVEFIGIQQQAELAGYVYEVLFRQLTNARTEYIKSLKRYKRANKTRKADIFAENWVHGVATKVSKFAQMPEHQNLIEQYKTQHYKSGISRLKDREHEHKKGDEQAAFDGQKAGKQVSISHGVKGHETAKLNPF